MAKEWRMTIDKKDAELDKQVVEHWKKHHELLPEVEEMRSDLIEELLDSLPVKFQGARWQSEYPELEVLLKNLLDRNVGL